MPLQMFLLDQLKSNVVFENITNIGDPSFIIASTRLATAARLKPRVTCHLSS